MTTATPLPPPGELSWDQIVDNIGRLISNIQFWGGGPEQAYVAVGAGRNPVTTVPDHRVAIVAIVVVAVAALVLLVRLWWVVTFRILPDLQQLKQRAGQPAGAPADAGGS